ncbi:hypothetical protein MNBD_BACTEROID04-1904 [hydrothermal vent metagenome]|uniref:Uncharacterized protein n=1 Tax=hydrothermal vent metagenome TaxID=652676 RepID=A0A3B0UJ71_9ZZZZ
MKVNQTKTIFELEGTDELQIKVNNKTIIVTPNNLVTV